MSFLSVEDYGGKQTKTSNEKRARDSGGHGKLPTKVILK